MRSEVPPLALVCLDCGATGILDVPPSDAASRVIPLVCPYCRVGRVRIARIVEAA